MAISPLSLADMMGADVKIMSDVYLTLKKQLDELKTQVDELKVANETFHEVRKSINEINEEYRFIRDFDPKAEIRGLQSWGQGQTGLGGFEDARSFDQKWAIIQREMDHRIEKAKKSDPGAAKYSGESMNQILQAMKDNERQQINYRNAANAADQEANTRYWQQLEASSSAMTASLLLEQKQVRLEREIHQREVLLEQIQWEGSFLKYLSKE